MQTSQQSTMGALSQPASSHPPSDQTQASQRQMQATSQEPPKQKRKYTKRLGPDGLPIPRKKRQTNTGHSTTTSTPSKKPRAKKTAVDEDSRNPAENGEKKKRGRPRKDAGLGKEDADGPIDELQGLPLLALPLHAALGLNQTGEDTEPKDSENTGKDAAAPTDTNNDPPSGAAMQAPTQDEPESEDDDLDFDTWAQFIQAGKKEDGVDYKLLESTLSEEDYDRYVMAYRSGLQRGTVKKLSQNLLSQSINDTISIIIAGAAKIFVGEMVERAKQVQNERNEKGAITTDQLREAYRRYRAESRGNVDTMKAIFSK